MALNFPPPSTVNSRPLPAGCGLCPPAVLMGENEDELSDFGVYHGIPHFRRQFHLTLHIGEIQCETYPVLGGSIEPSEPQTLSKLKRCKPMQTQWSGSQVPNLEVLLHDVRQGQDMILACFCCTVITSFQLDRENPKLAGCEQDFPTGL